ncbi:Uncharacterised protein [Chlamydia trachomatis]|nr:Uncharacterised protein [Chlamydia trachomatis]
MNNNQNHKTTQMTSETLIVGVNPSQAQSCRESTGF